jgi:FKBP-type peptidyl-prolyl cis-trans isomerase FkpA
MMRKPIYCILIFCAFTIAAKAQGDMQRTSSGALYKIFTHNTGDKIKLNDVITFDVIQKTDKDSVLYSSYAQGRPAKVQVQESKNVADLMEIFPLLTVNDSVFVKVPTDSVFKGHETSRPPFLPVGSNIDFVIKVERVESLNDAIAERNADIEKVKATELASTNKYIADNKLVLTPTSSGLKYIVTKTSVKPRPLNGDTVLVNYTGKLLTGQVFDSSIADVAKQAGLQQPNRTYEPIKLVLGHGDVIKGWEEALLLLHEGGKGTFIIPSSLAYGDQGGGDVIPPYSTLVFNIELVKVKRIPHPLAKKPLVKKHHPMVKKTN